MSAVEQRVQIISEYIPKLIEKLTEFKKNEENYKRCEDFAYNILKNHRNLSINSHEIKRKIEGMQEKLRVSNYKVYGDHLKYLVDQIVTHPICTNHYETDVGWSVIEFLFCLSYNPVGTLRENKNKISLQIVKDDDEEKDKEQEYWTNILKEDFIAIEQTQQTKDTDSELSEWSESDSETSNTKLSEDLNKTEKLSTTSRPVQIIPGVDLKPPEKQKNYVLFDGSQSETWLFENCQNSWWLDNKSEFKINSNLPNANFAHIWNHYLAEFSNNFIKMETISTESEYRLMREILWMLYTPQTCKFFIVDQTRNVAIRKNVSISSVSVDGLKIFLEQKYLPTIISHLKLRDFIKSIYSSNKSLSPKTYECYASCMKDLLEPYYEKILQVEQYVKDQLPATISTVIQMRNQLDNVFEYLDKLHRIHEQVILDLNKYPAHISSAYLLSSLMICFRNSKDVETSNITITLFMYSCRTFCDIMNTLWTEGILDDWRNEFVVEKYNDEKENLTIRLFEKSKEKSFHVSKNISNVIKQSAFLKLIINHAIEAGYTLNFLYEMDKINYLRNASNFEDNLFDQFFLDVLSSIKNFVSPKTDSNETTESESELNNITEDNCKKINDSLPNDESDVELNANTSNGLSKETCEALCKFELETNKDKQSKNINFSDKFSNKKFLAQCASSDDEFLVMAFSCNFHLDDSRVSEEEDNPDQKLVRYAKNSDLLQKLNNISQVVVPLEEIILDSICRILSYRISFTNSFVMKMYRDDFEIGKHLQNIRRVLLLEAGDLMQFFYHKLFNDIENEKLWANPFALTVQLDDILATKFQDMSLFFKVDIVSQFKCRTSRVIDAVDEIFITYNVRKELKNVITDDIIKLYNEVFHFLLKIKWSLWTLENLKFSRSHKNRPPYASFRVIDLNMRQLEQLRIWMMYSLNCIHCHLMTAVLQSMGHQLDEKIENCSNLAELKYIHKSYVKTIYEQCLLTSQYETVKAGVEQLFNLTFVIREQWKLCVKKLDLDYCFDETDNSLEEELIGNRDMIADIKSIEGTYVKCHTYLAKSLNNEVYWNQKEFLSPLLAAFQSSLPC